MSGSDVRRSDAADDGVLDDVIGFDEAAPRDRYPNYRQIVELNQARGNHRGQLGRADIGGGEVRVAGESTAPGHDRPGHEIRSVHGQGKAETSGRYDRRIERADHRRRCNCQAVRQGGGISPGVGDAQAERVGSRGGRRAHVEVVVRADRPFGAEDRQARRQGSGLKTDRERRGPVTRWKQRLRVVASHDAGGEHHRRAGDRDGGRKRRVDRKWGRGGRGRSDHHLHRDAGGSGDQGRRDAGYLDGGGVNQERRFCIAGEARVIGGVIVVDPVHDEGRGEAAAGNLKREAVRQRCPGSDGRAARRSCAGEEGIQP